MRGVFLSYSRADRAIADQIIHGLRAVGVEVWWDEDMRGVDWQEELERQISELGGVMVLWTPNSFNSKNVRDEARLGLETDKLINAVWGVPKPPFPYDRVNGLPLDGWTGLEAHRGWTRLIETIDEMSAAGGSKTGALVEALARREQAVGTKQKAIGRAQQAFHAAQDRAAEADANAETTSAALASAREDVSRVAEMRLGPAILRSAQQQLDAALAAREEAIGAQRAAKARLSESSRAVSRTTAELAALLSTGSQAPSVPSEMVVRDANARDLADGDSPVEEATPPVIEARPDVVGVQLSRDNPATPRGKGQPRRRALVYGGLAAVGTLVVLSIAALVMFRSANSPVSGEVISGGVNSNAESSSASATHAPGSAASAESASQPGAINLPAVDQAQELARSQTVAYFASWSGSDAASASSVRKYYARSIDYYGSTTDIDSLMATNMKFAQRWPVRNYTVREPLNVRCRDAHTCLVQGSSDWEASNPTAGTHASGVERFSLAFRDGLIVAESSKVVTRQ
jgi:hypothetical protein